MVEGSERDLPDCLSFDPRSDCVKDKVGLFNVSESRRRSGLCYRSPEGI